MNKKILIGTIVIVVLVGIGGYYLLTQKTTTPKAYRVAILSGADIFVDVEKGFKAKMTELGYIEGKNIAYDVQKTNFNPVSEKQIAKKFVDDKVDLIFVFPTEPSLIVKDAALGTNIPIVFSVGTIEVGSLVESLRNPGDHITGVRYPATDNITKRFEILHELVPNMKRLYVAYNSNYPVNKVTIKALHSMLLSLGIILVEVPVTSVREVQDDLDSRAKASDIGFDAILISPDPLLHSPDGFKVINEFAKKHNVPISSGVPETVDLGALFSYAPSNYEMGELAAPLADKIFNGIPAGTIPVASPESVLIINYKRAQELGLTVSQGLLNRADKIIR